jgi:hypothetical protein
MAERKRNVITIDSTMQHERMLRYKEKHSGWVIYKSVFWGMYVFILGLLLLTRVALTGPAFFGWAFVLFAIFFIVNGFASALHLKLMKKHG